MTWTKSDCIAYRALSGRGSVSDFGIIRFLRASRERTKPLSHHRPPNRAASRKGAVANPTRALSEPQPGAALAVFRTAAAFPSTRNPQGLSE